MEQKGIFEGSGGRRGGRGKDIKMRIVGQVIDKKHLKDALESS